MRVSLVPRRRRWPMLAAAGAVVLAGCVGPAAPAAPAAVSVSSSPAAAPTPHGVAVVAGGCGQSLVYRGAPPAWNPHPAGFNGQGPSLPYVLATGGTIMGYLWRFPLLAGRPVEPSNKILWYLRLPRAGNPLIVRAHPAGAAGPVVSYRFAPDSAPGEIYPTIIDVPRPGCWTLDLSWGRHTDRADLLYRG